MTNTIVDTLCDFIAYVDSFYNAETGIYPIKGMTNSTVSYTHLRAHETREDVVFRRVD